MRLTLGCWGRIVRYDLNLLTTLDALLIEGSVSGASRRLHLSDSAMSRALSRVREAFDDPILVRAGRTLVPTPRALALREEVRDLLERADALARPVALDAGKLARIFAIRANEGFVAEFGGRLVSLVHLEAPGAVIRFAVKADKDAGSLRDGQTDLDVGVAGTLGPEVRVQTLLRDRFIGVVDPQHPLAIAGNVTPKRYAGERHVSVSRRGRPNGPIDDALLDHGLSRHIAAIVSSFPAALALTRAGLVASVPDRQTRMAQEGLFTFELPVETPEVTVSMAWHPRFDADPAHRWLRDRMVEVCRL